MAFVLLMTGGCGRRETPVPAASAVTPKGMAVPAADPGADLAPVLAELTQSVRKFSFEKQRRPTSLEELVQTGYLSSVPQLSDGRRFSIDPKSMQVVVTKH